MDCAGNTIERTVVSFSIARPPVFNEVVITEILFDEVPSVGLPEKEFIEIYNTTSEVITTANMQLSDEIRTINMPVFSLTPHTYHVLTSTSGVGEFSGNVIGVSNFPSLRNSGEQLSLSIGEELIFSVEYNPDWHDENKMDGGYTLEMIDITNPCLEDRNWASSIDMDGGTPGQPNSQSETIPDSFGPNIVDVIAISSDSIKIDFDEKIPPHTTDNIMVRFRPPLAISRFHFDFRQSRTLYVILSENLQENDPHTIDISGVFDCKGNEEESLDFTFALASTTFPNDIKLNEVLFNPKTNGVDFVEIFNSSNRYLSLKKWKLARITAEGISDQRTISDEELVINPNEYLVFTTDPALLLTHYPKGQTRQFFEMPSLPVYANDTGNVVLLNDLGVVQERFFYNEDFHYDLLESVDGVSLERVLISSETNNPNNWRSAASTEGFATPGYANSQSFVRESFSGIVSVNPKVFIPGNLGSRRDFTTINYQFKMNGQFANVNIYDQTGRLIRNLAQGESLATSGFLRWDGITNSGIIARLGYYVVIFEVYDAAGNTEIFKNTVVVGRDF